MADPRSRRGRNNRLKRSAARFDYFPRSQVRLVTRRQHIGQPEFARGGKALPQNFRGISASPMCRENTEPNVAALARELLGESVPNRRTANYPSVYLRDQESMSNPTRREANPGTLPFNGCHERVPIRPRRQPESEGEALGLHLPMRFSDLCFVAVLQGPQIQHRHIVLTSGLARSRRNVPGCGGLAQQSCIRLSPGPDTWRETDG